MVNISIADICQPSMTAYFSMACDPDHSIIQDYSHYHECFYVLDYRLLLLYVPLKMGIEEQAVETITPEQAAKMLQVTPATIRKWLRKGELAGSETPAGWRITQADIEAWLAKYRREAKDTTT